MAEVPASPKKIHVEEVRYKSGVSEATLFKMAGSMNYLLQAFLPVGTILITELDEATFQSEIGSVTGNWVLCDGRSVVGSEFEDLTGRSSIADLRGRYPRMKDHGAGVDPNGDNPIGTHYSHELVSHIHSHTYFREDPPFNATHHRWQKGNGDATLTTNTNATGGNETRPVTTVVNFMIRID